MRKLMLVLAAVTFSAPPLFAQGVNDYVYVHKTLVDLTQPPWQCVCYSVSRSSVIITGNAGNQVWQVARYNDWPSAVVARDGLNAGPGVCSSCPGSTVASPKTGLFVFANCSRKPCEIGVAGADYTESGWTAISPAFGNHDAAWGHACTLHADARYVSPDIRDGRVDCASLGSRLEASGQPALSQVFSSTYGDIHWSAGYYGNTSKTLSVEDIAWNNSAGAYIVTGRWGRTNDPGKKGRFEFHFTSACKFEGYWWNDGKPRPQKKNWRGSCRDA